MDVRELFQYLRCFYMGSCELTRLIIFMEGEEIIPGARLAGAPVRLIGFYCSLPVGEICLIKRSDAKSDINHGNLETPASPGCPVRERK